ncbi:MAG TPA: DNA mismatch repair endonuclease MutL [Desulfomonilaceae bacterium]|nr:DNA mismatch repair endonuclease MutL [Desulfomonilaceae bacterium]
MVGRIKVLDEGVINRIAAGEVVERPVSVVKELLENSIDAEASVIVVDIESGGRKLIRVRDNGTGMSRDDAFLALERHATSKLESERDLVSVATMGFRGEALASIASVSKLRLVTKDDSDAAGTEIVVEGGVLRKSTQLGSGRGTMIEVRNLFYNVPVRRKFLKGPGVEADHIRELLVKFALAFPAIGFKFSEDGKSKMDAPAVRSTFERIHTLYSKDVRESLVPVDCARENAQLTGYVARPPYARSNMRSVLTFVNGRSVRDRLINASVNRAFSNLMERGRYPLAMLFLALPPEEVDVNVHPQKAEVRFVNPRHISDLILDGIHEALMGAPFRQPAGPQLPMYPRPVHSPVSQHLRENRESSEPAPSTCGAPVMAQAPPVDVSPSCQPLIESQGRFSSLGILGRLPNSFLVLYSEDELVVMDHHAAHERLLFDRLLKIERQGGTSDSQGLLIPKVLQYSAVESRALAAHLKLLEQAGFVVEEFGEKDFVVKSVPEWFGSTDLEGFFGELVEAMLDTGIKGDPDRLKEELLKRMACTSAVKETSTMHQEEIRSLLRELDHTAAVEVCPHGRPFTVRIPFNEIRKKMSRK